MDSTLRSDLIDDSPAKSLGRSTLLQAVKQGRLGPLSPLVAGLITLVLVLATLYVGWSVRSAMRSLIRDSISSVLTANVTALDIWLSEQADEAKRLAIDPRFSTWLARQNLPGDEVDPDTRRVMDLFSSEVRDRGYIGWALVGSSGMV